VCKIATVFLKTILKQNTQIKFYKATAVLILTYGSEIWSKTGAKIKNAEINFEGDIYGRTKYEMLKLRKN
jgi:hypothetical protein